MHGLGWDHRYLRPWLDPLGDRATLIYYDHRGCGRSTRPASLEGIGHDTWAADADALRAYLGHEGIIVFGHSYGGFLALEYALRYGNRLEGLILCDTAPAHDYAEHIIAAVRARGTPEQIGTFLKSFAAPTADDAHLQRFWASVLPLYFHGFDPAMGAAMLNRTRFSAAATNHAIFRCLPAFNTLGQLHRISAPALIIAGRHDIVAPPHHGAERLHAALPLSELVVLEESGHFPFIEQQNEFLAAVRNWLDRLA